MIQGIINLYQTTLPFFSMGMGWIVPSICGLVVGIIISVVRKD